jgi:putative FmdB family regulatory protein
MPIHEFQCKSCGYVFEILSMSKEEMDDVRCAKCASPEVTKLMSASNISVSDTVSKSNPSAQKSYVQHHQCQSGSCSHLNLAGHSRD